MTQKLPIAILSPHGGLAVPPELEDRIALSPTQIFNEADSYADDIFDFKDRVKYWLNFPYARAIIDLNRPPDARYRGRPGDGIIKRITSYGDPVYKANAEPDETLKAELVEKYWQPWHTQLAQIAQDPEVRLVIDCHSMAAIGPARYGDPGQLRPRFTIANFGDASANLNSTRGFLTAAPWIAQTWANYLETAGANIPILAPTGPVVTFNTPYWGGWNLSGHYEQAKQPWLMIEINRALYIGNQTPTNPIVPRHPGQISALKALMWDSLEYLVNQLKAETMSIR